jgi:succinyl-CoA synthetase alpha subunit
MEFGTNLVAGVTPGRGGTVWEEKVPIFNSVSQAVSDTIKDWNLLFPYSSASARGHTSDKIGTELHAPKSMKTTFSASDALNKQAGVIIY